MYFAVPAVYVGFVCHFTLECAQLNFPGCQQHGNSKERREFHLVRMRPDHHDPRHREGAQGPRRQHPGTVSLCWLDRAEGEGGMRFIVPVLS